MKAMILSAGFGTRLGGLTKETPKPMLDINSRPLLEYIILNLAQYGFSDICINLHVMPEAITSYFGDGDVFNVRIRYSYETSLLGTAGGVKKMAEVLKPEEPFLVHYGDIITNQNLRNMYNFHRKHDPSATLLLHQRSRSNSIVVLDESNRIIRFLERPSEEERLGINSPWVNSGICILDPCVLSLIPDHAHCDLPKHIFSRLVDNGKAMGFPLTGYRCAIDSPQRLKEAQEAITAGILKVC